MLDLDAISSFATRAAYRTLLAEGDGVRSELVELAQRCPLDVDQAHAALGAEALGGIPGTEDRLRALLGAFAVPTALVEAALGEGGVDALDGVRHFPAKGWPRTLADFLVGGLAEEVPLTRRTHPLARAARPCGTDQRPGPLSPWLNWRRA